jgi:hypothetical protein
MSGADLAGATCHEQTHSQTHRGRRSSRNPHIDQTQPRGEALYRTRSIRCRELRLRLRFGLAVKGCRLQLERLNRR